MPVLLSNLLSGKVRAPRASSIAFAASVISCGIKWLNVSIGSRFRCDRATPSRLAQERAASVEERHTSDVVNGNEVLADRHVLDSGEVTGEVPSVERSTDRGCEHETAIVPPPARRESFLIPPCAPSESLGSRSEESGASSGSVQSQAATRPPRAQSSQPVCSHSRTSPRNRQTHRNQPDHRAERHRHP